MLLKPSPGSDMLYLCGKMLKDPETASSLGNINGDAPQHIVGRMFMTVMVMDVYDACGVQTEPRPAETQWGSPQHLELLPYFTRDTGRLIRALNVAAGC